MPDSAPNVLLIGAGAVGQVYGYHLSCGGARVSFFVRGKYVESLRGGMPLYPLNRQKLDQPPVLFDDFQLLTQVDEVAAQSWDQVWLCVSSPALQGDWLPPLLEAAGDATIVSLTPGLKNTGLLLQHVDESRLVLGVITLLSYTAPLPGETVKEPGMAYWFPPLAPGRFSGPQAHRDAVIQTLKRGGQPAARHRDVGQMGATGTATLMPLLMGLEHEQWSFKRFGKSESIRQGARGVREALTIVCHDQGIKPPFIRHFMRPWIIRMLLKVSGWLMPLSLEAFFKYHFTKVGDQTRQFIDQFIDLGAGSGLKTTHLKALRSALQPPNAENGGG